jgi:hypothetical protein
MATQKKTTYKTKSDPVLETRLSIEEQTAAFLQGGGRIQRIANGVSGRVETTEAKPNPAKKAAVQKVRSVAAAK